MNQISVPRKNIRKNLISKLNIGYIFNNNSSLKNYINQMKSVIPHHSNIILRISIKH